MNKTRLFEFEGKKYQVVSGFPQCQGCENLTLTWEGWCCYFNGEHGDGCEYPLSSIQKGRASYVGHHVNLNKEKSK